MALLIGYARVNNHQRPGQQVDPTLDNDYNSKISASAPPAATSTKRTSTFSTGMHKQHKKLVDFAGYPANVGENVWLVGYPAME